MKECKVESCKGIVRTKGYCGSHYMRYIRYGNSEVPLKRTTYGKNEICSFEGCVRKPTGKGLCTIHYTANRLTDKNARQDHYSKKKLANHGRLEKLMGRSRPERCEICNEVGYTNTTKAKVGIVFDHCHVTGKPRGWLCDRCNKTLGLVKDDPELLKKLIQYLEVNSDILDNAATEETNQVCQTRM